MRPWVVASGMVVVAIGAFTIVDALDRPSGGEMRFVQEVPDDVLAESEATWERFIERFAARATCWSDVTIELVRVVDGGDARYVAANARIEIQIPTTPARYRESLAHELAHHVERTCPDFEPLRQRLLREFGSDDWATGPIWEEIPAERYAEAVVDIVNGDRIRHENTVEVDPAVTDLITRWGRGDVLATDPVSP